jgi:hypothetical protein
MTSLLVEVLLLILATGSPAETDTLSSEAPSIESGYRQMYDLQFEEAHQTFQAWEQIHPDDPMGPSSNAAAFLFSEFNRMGILQAEFFSNDEAMKKSRKLAPDPASKQGFENSLAKSEQLADAILARSPRDENALFAKVLDFGLRSDYAGLIEKRLLASLGYMKNARLLAQRLLAINPSNYDAYLAVGVENYILGSSPAPVRWVLQIFGAQANRMQGIEKVRLTAEKGHYLLPFARLLLAVAALRDKNRDQARGLLEGLAREFPHNRLYWEELARLRQPGP